ncbi:MAG: hypothetical protein WB542_09660 [Polaromonas sp.]
MPRFSAPPPNIDSRKAIQQRAREALEPAAAEKKGNWPFPAENALPANTEQAGIPPANSGKTGN